MVYAYPLAPIANFLAAILAAVPLSRDVFHSWNIGVFMYAIWVAILSFTNAVNAVVWSDNTNNVAPVWCDITTHLFIASPVAIPACSLVITRRFVNITRNRVIEPGNKQKRTDLAIDLFLCVGLPVINMVLYYVVQDSRYAIIESMGCVAAISGVTLAVPLLYVVPVILPLISLVFYCPTIIWLYFRHRTEMDEFLRSNPSINRQSYFRILALGSFDILITLPTSIINFYATLQDGDSLADFWPGWSSVHDGFSSIETATIQDLQQGGEWARFNIIWNSWINPFLAFAFFALFGLRAQARARYRRAFWVVLKRLGFQQRVDPVLSDVMFEPVPAAKSDSGVLSHEAGRSSQGVRSRESVMEEQSGDKEGSSVQELEMTQRHLESSDETFRITHFQSAPRLPRGDKDA